MMFGWYTICVCIACYWLSLEIHTIQQLLLIQLSLVIGVCNHGLRIVLIATAMLIVTYLGLLAVITLHDKANSA